MYGQNGPESPVEERQPNLCLIFLARFQGAYFVSRQVNGTAVYHDVLPAAGNRFVDMTQFPRALGFELPWTWPRKGVRGNNDKGDSGVDCKDGRGMASTCRSSGSGSGPEDTAECARVIRLDFLLGDVVERLHGLDFRTFRANDRLQPLHVVVSLLCTVVCASHVTEHGNVEGIDQHALIGEEAMHMQIPMPPLSSRFYNLTANCLAAPVEPRILLPAPHST